MQARSNGWLSSLTIATLLAVTTFAQPAQAESKKAQAKRLNAQATQAFNLGHFRDAAKSYEQAYAAKALPLFLFNLGQCYKRLPELADLERAKHFFESFLTNSKSTDPDRPEAKKEIAELKGKIAAMKKKASVGEQDRPDLVAPTPAPTPTTSASTPVYKKWWFWTLVGVAVAGATTAAAVALQPDDVAPIKGSLDPGQIQFELRPAR